jgi:hypothetical protein
MQPIQQIRNQLPRIMLVIAYKHGLELPNSPLQNRRRHGLIRAIPHLLNQLAICLRQLPLSPNLIGQINLLKILSRQKIVSHTHNTRHTLYATIHKARITQIPQPHNPPPRLLRHDRLLILIRRLSLPITSILMPGLILILALLRTVEGLVAAAKHRQLFDLGAVVAFGDC